MKIIRYVNLYRDDNNTLFTGFSLTDDAGAAGNRIATQRVEFEIGDGEIDMAEGLWPKTRAEFVDRARRCVGGAIRAV